MRPRIAPAGGLVAALAAALLSLGAASAYGATAARHYRGTTSQHEPISFAISGGMLKRLRFRIEVTCPSGHKYRIEAFNFPAIQITGLRFDQSFRSNNPKATARIRGRARARAVTGTLTDRTMIKREHNFCSGKATFRLAQQRSTRAPVQNPAP